MATIYDVAKAAKVSTATVSAVLNDSAFVSDRLAARVHAAVAALGYQPNLLARGLASHQTRTLGLIVPDITHPFFSEVARGAEDTARAAGYSLIVGSSDNDLKREESHLRFLLARRVDGVLLTKAPGPPPTHLMASLSGASVPIVLVARAASGFESDVIEVDDRSVAFEAVSHLMRLGYRRIGFVTGAPRIALTAHTVEGYRAALRAGSVTLDPDLVVEGPHVGVDAGYAAGLELMKHRPDSVVVDDYLNLLGVLKVMKQYGLRSPADLALVACDDHPSLDAFTPSITAVDISKRDLGSRAARLLIERIESPARPRQTIRLTGTLRIRDSCGSSVRGSSVVGRGRRRSGDRATARSR